MRSFPRATCLLVIAALSGTTAHAQTPAPAAPPAFEVASVKPSAPNGSGPLAGIPVIRPAGDTLVVNNVPLRLLIRLAYGVEDFQIVGGPSWQLSQKFDVNAKLPDGLTIANSGAMGPMLKTLLADRFKLKTHTETKEMPVYALVLAHSDGKLGPQLKPSTSDCSDPQSGQRKLAEQLSKEGPVALAGRLQSGEQIPCTLLPMLPGPRTPQGQFGMRSTGLPITGLTKLLTTATGRMVEDKTGLTGGYDWTLSFDPQIFLAIASQAGINVPPGAAAALPPSDSPSLLTAIQEQLGLKLESTRGPVDVLVIDSAEMPEPD